MSVPLDFETLVKRYHRDLFHFAFSLAGNEADASDLMQQTFYIWAAKGSQLRDPRSAKRWLFTTLHREFLQMLRRQNRFKEHELDEACAELPDIATDIVDRLDGTTVLECLSRLEERYRAPLALYYMEDYSYLEIGSLLDIPLGTVQSRIARGKAQLLRMLTTTADKGNAEEARHD
jgi:RNA polymerase sigma factor (sigma-70 family)